MLVPLTATLVVTLACTVGEARPRMPGPGDEVPVEAGGEPGAAADTMAAADEDVYRSMDLLVRSQLAYEATNVDESLTLAEQVLDEYPGSGAAEPARWVGARAAFALGRYSRARELALDYAADQREGSPLAQQARELARLAEDGMAEPAPAPPLIGAILPRSGPQVLVRYGDWVLEGLKLAVAEVERQQGRPIELAVVDDAGGSRTRSAVAELERRGALAIIGPLLPQQLPVAAEARQDPRRVLISPTAPGAPEWPESYSISMGDSRGAQELGQFAADVGFRQAAVLFARGAEYRLKAEAFVAEYETVGGRVRAVVPYDSGTTTFGPHMDRILASVAPGAGAGQGTLVDSLIAVGLVPDRATADTMSVDSLLALIRLIRLDSVAVPVDSIPADPSDLWSGAPQQPFALFVSAPQQDVPKIAPQVGFYGLDSAGVQVFGDEAWASADVRRVVPARDLEGVIAASHFPPDRASSPADPRFVEIYEARYRKSLDNLLPALAYDAANLVLQALPNRLLTPDALARRFGFLTGIRGATGLLSVRGGEVVRTPYLVQIQAGQLKPAPYPWEYEMPVPRPPKPDTADGGRRR